MNPVCNFAFFWVQKQQNWLNLLDFNHCKDTGDVRPHKLPWQHSWTCAYAFPDETDICRWWKNSRAHQYRWFRTNNGRVFDLSHPMTDGDPTLLSRMQSEKKGVLSVALKALFPPWDGKRGEQLFLDYRAGKVFWCSTCSCFIKPRLKVLLPRTPYASEQPSLCHAVIYDHCATLIPRSALLHKTCFPPPPHTLFFSSCFCS